MKKQNKPEWGIFYKTSDHVYLPCRLLGERNQIGCSRLKDLGQVKSKCKVQVVLEFFFGLIEKKKRERERQYKKSECRPHVRLYWVTVLFARCDHGILASYENAQTF